MKSVSDIIDQFKQVLNYLASPLANFTPYSNIYAIFRAIAAVISQQYADLNANILNSSLLTATGADLDDRAAEYGLTRLGGSPAQGYILCTATNFISIPQGTIFNSPNSTYQFQTTQIGNVGSTAIFVGISSISLTEGANLANNTVLSSPFYPTVTAIVGSSYDINGNLIGGLTGGTSPEVDSTFRTRVVNYLANLSKGTIGAIANKLYALGLTKFFITEGYPVTGYFTIYIDSLSQTVLDLVESSIFLVKPLGVSFQILPINSQYVDLKFVVVISSLTLADTISSAIKTTCSNYANTLGLGQTLYPANFATLCGSINGIVSIQLTSPTDTQITPPSDTLIKLRNIYVNLSGVS